MIDEKGKMTFEKVCSEDCATEVQQELYHLHNNRAEEMLHQQFQRLR